MKDKKSRSRLNAPGVRTLPKAYQPSQTSLKTRGNADKQHYVTRIQALEKQFAKLCTEIYELGVQRFVPMNPYVLVRLIPRDMMSAGGILIPDQGQNKPVFEGIVLETWRPYVEYRSKSVAMDDYLSPPCTETIAIHHECPVKPGDRVAFPYYEGVPCQYLGDNYKLVRQSCDQNKFPYQQILGVIDYQGDKEVAAELTKLMNKYYYHSVTTSGVSASRGASPNEIAK